MGWLASSWGRGSGEAPGGAEGLVPVLQTEAQGPEGAGVSYATAVLRVSARDIRNFGEATQRQLNLSRCMFSWPPLLVSNLSRMLRWEAQKPRLSHSLFQQGSESTHRPGA